MSTTRFSYGEHVLEFFEKSLFALRAIVRIEKVNNIFAVMTLVQKLQILNKFGNFIEDDTFLKNVHKAFKILRPMTIYFR